MLAAGVIRDDLQAHLALARVGEQPPSSTPTSLPVRTTSTSTTAASSRCCSSRTRESSRCTGTRDEMKAGLAAGCSRRRACRHREGGGPSRRQAVPGRRIGTGLSATPRATRSASAASANTHTTRRRASVSASAAVRLARVLVEAGDRARQPAHRLLGLPDDGRRLLVQLRGLEQRRRRVVDDRQPLVGGVAVGVAVELERAVAAVQGVGRVGLGGGEKLLRELCLRARRGGRERGGSRR